MFIVSTLLLSGCSSKGMVTAGHNGKKYWNPGNCDRYNYSYNNPDAIKCLDSNGNETGQVLYPVDQQQLDNYYREQESYNRSSYSNSYSNMVSCYKFGDIGFNKQIYQFKGSFCPVGYMKAY